MVKTKQCFGKKKKKDARIQRLSWTNELKMSDGRYSIVQCTSLAIIKRKAERNSKEEKRGQKVYRSGWCL